MRNQISILIAILAYWAQPGISGRNQGVIRADQPAPPAPPPATQTLRTPKGIEPKLPSGEAQLPARQKLGFALDLGGSQLVGNWNVQGKVVSVGDGVAKFQTADGKTGRLVYRLPPGGTMQLAPGQSIAIVRHLRIQGARLAYDLEIRSGSAVIAAASRQYHNHMPVAARNPNRLFGADAAPLNRGSFTISDKDKVLARDTKFATIYNVPVEIAFPGSVRSTAKTLMKGEGANLTFDRERNYSLFVTDSREVVPKDRFKGVVEGQGYTLEYVAVANPKPAARPE